MSLSVPSLSLTVSGVEQVDREESSVIDGVGWFPGQGDDLPVPALGEALDDTTADDAAGSSNKSDFSFHRFKPWLASDCRVQ